MDQKVVDQKHLLNLCDRKNVCMTGILDVESFDTQEVLLQTTQGRLTIKGSEMHVKRLSLEKGEMDIEGNFDSIVYSNGKTRGRKKGESVLGHLFS